MAQDPSEPSAAAQRAAARMAARAAAARQAEADGRDPVEAARAAAADVTQRERRARSRGLRASRSARSSAPRPPRPTEPTWNRDAPVPPLTPAGSGVSHVPSGAVQHDGDDDLAPPSFVDLGPFTAEELGQNAEAVALSSGDEGPANPKAAAGTGRARNTVIFSVLTGFSRVAGLFREVLASRFYGTSGSMSAFTLAFQIPNLLRALFADAALSAAFVPVFSDLLQQGRRKDAMKLAAELAWLVLLGLTALVAVSILLTPLIVPLIVDPKKLGDQDVRLAVHLTQVMFPVVALLGVNGLLVGILNAEDHFTVPALSPVVWNVLIMLFMIVSHVTLDGGAELYGYAIGVLVGTVAQLAMAVPMVKQAGFRWGPLRLDGWRDPEVRHVLTLMVPVAIGLGLVNFDLVINSTLGFQISNEVPRAIDAAFRLYMLPQGIFSVAIATVLFPALSRAAARVDYTDLRAIIGDGMRLILVLLIPAAAFTIALATPIIRLIYQGGEFDAHSTELASKALWVFSLTLPLNGLNLLLTRTFFALKDPWATTRLAVFSLVVNLVFSLALYKPLGIEGIVAGTVISNFAIVVAQLRVLSGRLGGSLLAGETFSTTLRVLVGAALLTAVALGVDSGIRSAIGSSPLALAISLSMALGLGGLAYIYTLKLLQVKEAVRLEGIVRARFSR